MEHKIHKIMACVDFSEYSPMVLEYAAVLSKGMNSQILVFNVISQMEIDGAEKVFRYNTEAFTNGMDMEHYVSDMKKERYEKLTQFIGENFFNENSIMSIKIDAGIPFECILQTIETEDIDLVVVANKGQSNIARVLFGSTAEKVFRHSTVPVINVRDRKRFKREKSY